MTESVQSCAELSIHFSVFFSPRTIFSSSSQLVRHTDKCMESSKQTENRDKTYTRGRENIHPPRPKLSLGKGTFRYSGAILLNSLPETYKRAASLEAFKRLMIKHDFA